MGHFFATEVDAIRPHAYTLEQWREEQPGAGLLESDVLSGNTHVAFQMTAGSDIQTDGASNSTKLGVFFYYWIRETRMT